MNRLSRVVAEKASRPDELSTILRRLRCLRHIRRVEAVDRRRGCQRTDDVALSDGCNNSHAGSSAPPGEVAPRSTAIPCLLAACSVFHPQPLRRWRSLCLSTGSAIARSFFRHAYNIRRPSAAEVASCRRRFLRQAALPPRYFSFSTARVGPSALSVDGNAAKVAAARR